MTSDTIARRHIELVVFDFDGTLCDSADIKTVAFRNLYLDEHGEDFASVVEQYHLAHAGLPRFDKIRHIETHMLGSEPTEERVDQVANRFSSLVVDAVVAAPMFDGVWPFLDAYHERIPLTIASATPTDELRLIVERKGIDGYFAAVEGSPNSKATIIRHYGDRFGIATTHTAMIGDQPSDAAAAEETGAVGIMIAPDEPWVANHLRVDTFDAAATALSRMIAQRT